MWPDGVFRSTPSQAPGLIGGSRPEGLGENVCTMERLDPAPSTAYVGRKPSVARNTVTFRSHGIPSRECVRLFNLVEPVDYLTRPLL